MYRCACVESQVPARLSLQVSILAVPGQASCRLLPPPQVATLLAACALHSAYTRAGGVADAVLHAGITILCKHTREQVRCRVFAVQRGRTDIVQAWLLSERVLKARPLCSWSSETDKGRERVQGDPVWCGLEGGLQVTGGHACLARAHKSPRHPLKLCARVVKRVPLVEQPVFQ